LEPHSHRVPSLSSATEWLAPAETMGWATAAPSVKVTLMVPTPTTTPSTAAVMVRLVAPALPVGVRTTSCPSMAVPSAFTPERTPMVTSLEA